MASQPERLLVQIASYNTNLQGVLGLPQDLVDWLAPTLQVSHFLARERRAPDIVAVGFQELLPLHLGRTFFGSTAAAKGLLTDLSVRIFQVRNREQRCAYSVPNRSACAEQGAVLPYCKSSKCGRGIACLWA